jgi:hypothetical protein
MNRVSVVTTVLCCVSVLPPAAALGQRQSRTAQSSALVTWNDFPASQLDVATPVTIAWTPPGDAQSRARIRLPNGGWFGMRGAADEWTPWSAGRGSVNYRDFLLEGRYTFEVQVRGSDGRVQSTTRTFDMRFLLPDVRAQGLTINWQYVNQARDRQERFRRLAAEYDAQASTWRQIYERERRVLNASYSLDEFARELVGIGTEEAFLRWADAGSVPGLDRFLQAKTLYDILKVGGRDAFLIVRNVRTNRAAIAAVTAAWSAEWYRRLAAQQ